MRVTPRAPPPLSTSLPVISSIWSSKSSFEYPHPFSTPPYRIADRVQQQHQQPLSPSPQPSPSTSLMVPGSNLGRSSSVVCRGGAANVRRTGSHRRRVSPKKRERKTCTVPGRSIVGMQTEEGEDGTGDKRNGQRCCTDGDSNNKISHKKILHASISSSDTTTTTSHPSRSQTCHIFVEGFFIRRTRYDD